MEKKTTKISTEIDNFQCFQWKNKKKNYSSYWSQEKRTEKIKTKASDISLLSKEGEHEKKTTR